MKVEEYAVMARVEADHWWYRGLRDALLCALRACGADLPENPRILDAGCGTGENLRFLAGAFVPDYLGGFDASPDALRLAREKAPDADVYAGDLCEPEIRATDLDLVISMDVVYIPGAEKARAGLRTLASQLRPGGLFVLNLPAYEWLRSEHDLAIHTRERYTRRAVEALVESLDLEVVLSTYRLCLLFPLVAVSRLLGSLRSRGRPPETARSDLHSVPGPFASRLLYATLRIENEAIAHGLSWPWGSSVMVVGRKP